MSAVADIAMGIGLAAIVTGVGIIYFPAALILFGIVTVMLASKAELP